MGWKAAAALAVIMLAGSEPAWTQDSPAGFYYITPGGIGAGYADYFALFEDGTWEYGDQYQCSEDGAANDETVLSRSGDWTVDGSRLVLTEQDRTVIRGGACHCDAIACSLDGGSEGIEHTGLEIEVDLDAACAPDRVPTEVLVIQLPCLTIEGTAFYRLGRAEDMLP